MPPRMERCPDCEGTGRWPLHEKADGPGFECEECDGAGTVRNLARVPLAKGFDLSACYAAIVYGHGGVAYLPLVFAAYRTDYGQADLPPVYFTMAGGVEGLLMGLKPDPAPAGGDPR
jgi:hypothetical protein